MSRPSPRPWSAACGTGGRGPAPPRGGCAAGAGEGAGAAGAAGVPGEALPHYRLAAAMRPDPEYLDAVSRCESRAA
ncbi:MAG TPA: hypothetical protein VKD26_04840 [Streptosporangiaceae bacterium]|nr:hypothetical protein [Streptosporangiaceae bacterium]